MSQESEIDKLSEDNLLEKRFFQTIFEANAAGIFVVDENRDIVMVNQRFCNIVGFSKQELIGKNASFTHISQETYERFREYFLKAKEEGSSKIEYFVKKKGTSGTWVEMFGSPIELEKNRYGVIWSILDISERKQVEEIIRYYAFYDPLTGLVNRRLLEDRLEVIVESKKRSDSYSALIFLDLDNFKVLNDTYGHEVGDVFLKEVASRLLNSLRKTDTVARIGGDEFVIIVNDLSTLKVTATNQLQKIANSVLDSIKRPFTLSVTDKEKGIKKIEHISGASIGLNLFNHSDTTKELLLREADEAMYEAKKSGKNRIKFFSH